MYRIKKICFVFPFVGMLALLWISCNQGGNESTKEEDLAKIDSMYLKYIYGVSNNDLDLFMETWADDATRCEPGIHALHGKENIRRNFAEKFGSSGLDWGYIEYTVHYFGDKAYTTGLATLIVIPFDGSPEMPIDIEVFDILKKQEDGSWLIDKDYVNYQPVHDTVDFHDYWTYGEDLSE